MHNITIHKLKHVLLFFFQPYWMKSKEYWNNSFDERYKKLHEDVINKKRLPLKVSLENPSYCYYTSV